MPTTTEPLPTALLWGPGLTVHCVPAQTSGFPTAALRKWRHVSQSAAQVTAHLQQLEVFPKSVNMEKVVQYYGRFPMRVYQDTDALLRVAGGAKEHCLLGEWQ